MYVDDDCGYEFDDEFGTVKVIKTISNGEHSVSIYQKEDGRVFSSDNNFFSNINNDDFDDALEEFECGWRETHWNTSDWADWYGCDEKDLADAMDNDMRDYD